MNQHKLATHTWIIALPLLCALQVSLSGYRTTLAEPDIEAMMAGFVYGGVSGEYILAGFHYGRSFSFGFYQLLYLLLPSDALRDPDRVASAINYLGIGMAFLFALGLCLMLDKLTARAVALFCSIACLFSPLSLPFLASGHPMIGACAFLFLACAVLLYTAENEASIRPAPGRIALFGMSLTLVCIMVFIGLTLRAEIALAFPYLVLCFWIKLRAPWKQRLLPTLLVGALLLLAFGAFLLCQKPYVATDGGAANALSGYISEYKSIKRIVRGLVVLVLAFGIVSAVWLTVALLGRLRGGKPATPASGFLVHWPLALAALALVLPSLLFWLTNPTPARHFILPMVGLYLLLGLCWAHRIHTQGRAIGLAVMLVLGNQAAAELMHPIVVKHYQWSYDAGGLRRATQQVPLGLFPLDQQANMAVEASLRQEAIDLAARNPARLIILADSKHYLAAHLLASDTALRQYLSKVGPVDALLLSRNGRSIYLIEKLDFWPKDVLAEVQALREFAEYPLYVQKATISRHDKTQPEPSRVYTLE